MKKSFELLKLAFKTNKVLLITLTLNLNCDTAKESLMCLCISIHSNRLHPKLALEKNSEIQQ